MTMRSHAIYSSIGLTNPMRVEKDPAIWISCHLLDKKKLAVTASRSYIICMKVGDLVKCLTGSCGTAIIVEFHKTSGLYWIMMTRNGRMCAFQPQHLELISAGR